MKAAVLTAKRTIETRELPAPRIEGDDDVLIRMTHVGVCGSDLHYFSEDWVGDDLMDYPVVLGHECAGVVEAVGRGVRRVKPGDAVAVEPAVSCGKCDQCLAGRRNTCRNISFMGHKKERRGALAELAVMPEGNCFRLGKGMTPVRAVLAEPFSIGMHAVRLAGGVEQRTVGILGCGPIGLSAAIAAGNEKAGRLYMTEIAEARRKAAEEHAGAVWTGNPRATDIVAEIMNREPGGLDVVLDCTGEQEAIDQAVEMLKPGGTLVLVGIPLPQRISFNIGRIRRKELTLRNVRRQNMCFEPALRMLAGGKADLDFMATHFFPLERAGEAFETALARRDGVIKAMVTLGA